MIEVGTLREENGRAVGMRTMHPAMLRKIADRMDALGQFEAARAVRAWLDPAEWVPDKVELDRLLPVLEDMEAEARKLELGRDATYLEAARFCVQALLQ